MTSFGVIGGPQVLPYARATRCPVLTERMLLWQPPLDESGKESIWTADEIRYAMSGTDAAHAARCLRVATLCPVLTLYAATCLRTS
eukprot:1329594-Rhodomonas_salina.2